MSNDPDRTREGQLSSDRETIEQWAEDHDAVPVREAGAARDERFRVVPETEVRENQEIMDWDQFFDELDQDEQVVIYREDAETEPFEVAGRQEVVERIDDEDVTERLMEGETVTGTITETRVVEEVVVEELEVESTLVESDVVEDRVVDVELLDLECTRCGLEEVAGEDARDWFDTDRYLDAVSEQSVTRFGEESRIDEARTIDEATGEIDEDDQYPYRGDLDVEETWAVTRELLEEYVVESHLVESPTTGADTMEEYGLEPEDLHRSIVDQGVFEDEAVLKEYDVQSRVHEDQEDTIHTTFSGTRRVEDQIVDHKQLTAEFTSGEYLGMDLLQTRDIGWTEEGTATGATTEGTAAETTGRAEISEDVVGNTVVNAEGDSIGMVSDVDPGQDRLYVDVDPGVTESVMTTMGWGDHGEDHYPLGSSEIAGISDDEVRLKGPEEIEGNRGEQR